MILNPAEAGVTAPADTPEPSSHNHLGAYTAVAGCPRCASLGAINPDTLTPWPALTEHGEQVITDAVDRFHDRYDGENFSAALEQAVTEAYQRGLMQGRRDLREDARRRAAAHRDEARQQHALADAALRADASTVSVLAHTGRALASLRAAAALEGL